MSINVAPLNADIDAGALNVAADAVARHADADHREFAQDRDAAPGLVPVVRRHPGRRLFPRPAHRPDAAARPRSRPLHPQQGPRGAGALPGAGAARVSTRKRCSTPTARTAACSPSIRRRRDHLPGHRGATGSLGHGLPIGAGHGAGRAASRRRLTACIALLSDGECNEGSVWEAAMFAAAQTLDNLCVVVDYNKWQATGRSDEVMALAPAGRQVARLRLDRATRSTATTCGALGAALRDVPNGSGKPVAIVAHTVKGKGVSFMEDDNNWHYRIPTRGRGRAGARRARGRVMRNAFADEVTQARARRRARSSCSRATSATGCSTISSEQLPTASSTAASPKPT